MKHKFPLKIGADEKLKTSNNQLIIKIARISLLLALISLLYVHVFINLDHKYIIYSYRHNVKDVDYDKDCGCMAI